MTFHIEEITLGEDDCANEWADEHIEGLQKVGGGLYARAYTSDATPYVVKIFRMNDGGYLSYLHVMSELGIKNPHLPVIHRVILHRKPNEPYQSIGVVYMEKLTPGTLSECNDWGQPIGERSEHEKVTTRLSNAAWELPNKGIPEGTEHFEAEVLTLISLACEHGQKFHPDADVCYDLHTGNIMWRGNTWVVTDPLS